MKKNMIAALAILFLATGCGGPHWTDATLDEENHYIVRVQHFVEKGQVADQDYRHPVDIGPEEVAVLLGDLEYTRKSLFMDDSSRKPVFQDQEIARIAPVISNTIESLKPDERIAFTSFNRGGGLVFEKRRKTDWFMFADAKDRLHLAFTGINEVIPVERSATQAEKKRPYDEPGEAVANTSIVPANAYIERHVRESGKAYPTWVEVDLAALREAVETTSEEKPAGERDISPETDPEEYRDHIRSQLEYLKALHDDGLISDSEYDQKRKALIDKIE